jgi:ribosomal protein S18 acetylase RimI-like enzyme
VIRRATQADADAIREISERVFAQFGDYGTYLPRYLDDSWVTTTLYLEASRALGFVMVGLVPSRRQGGGVVADLLAIAVAPEHQDRGVGSELMRHALEVAGEHSRRFGITTIELSVADTNPAAQRFFERHGFTVVDPTEGRYPAGQTAIRMSRALAPTGAPAGAGLDGSTG